MRKERQPTLKTILYIHGFASSGHNGTAIDMRSHFYPLGISVLSPDLPLSPLEALDFIKKYREEKQPMLMVAPSMGALYAEQLHGIPKILVNPSFHMSRTLQFKGLGKREFRNKREDGQQIFTVDKQMIDEFREVEKNSFKGLDEQEKKLVWGLFGKNDRLVNCQKDFKQHYGSSQMVIFEGDHYLNGAVFKRQVLPLIEQIIAGR